MQKSPKVYFFTLLALLIIAISIQPVNAQPPDYAKWGKLALDEVKTLYPESSVSDYEYLGRTTITSTKSQDVFDFIVTIGNSKKLVRSYVSFNPKNNQLIEIRTKEIQL